jgi:hypothetical protein
MNNKITDDKMSEENLLLENSILTLNDTCLTGSNILIDLNSQYEKLESTNDVLESDEYLLNKALKIIRNMTWGGIIWNFLYAEPILTLNSTNEHVNPNKYIVPNENVNVNPNENVNSNEFNKNILFSNNIDSNKNIQNNKSNQDKYLEQISLKLDELEAISIKISSDLDERNNLINQIDTNIEIVTNKMLKVELETKKITNYHEKLNYKIIGRFNFIDLESGLALGTDDIGTIKLTNKIDSSTIFICYSTSNNIFCIQNYKTQKYLKTNFFGNIGFYGNYIGTYEQCFLHLDISNKLNLPMYNQTGIIILSKNNYHGGWLKKPIYKLNQDLPITNTTSNTTDHTDIILFQPIKLD